jgi:hypothetical protein
MEMKNNGNGMINRTTLSGDQQQFLDAVAEVLRQKHPDWRFKPMGFGFDIVTDEDGPIRLNLDNIFLKTSCNPNARPQLVDDFLQSLDRTLAERDQQEFGHIRDKLFLAMRPATFLVDNIDDDMNAAFRVPIAPDMAVFWAIDRSERIQHVSKDLFRSWDATVEDVTRIAYENTVKAERSIDITKLADRAMWITSRSSIRTVAHLLYWLPGLTHLIEQHVPALASEPALVCVPTPSDLVVTEFAGFEWIHAEISKLLRCGTPMLSRSIYELRAGDLATHVALTGSHRLEAMPLGAFGFQRGPLPFVPERQSHAIVG